MGTMMKKVFVLLLVLSAWCMEGLGQQQLEGLWQLDVDQSLELAGNATKERYDSLSPERQARVRSALTGRSFHFQSGGTITVLWKAGAQQRESSGTWMLGSEPGTVNITIGDKLQVFDYSFTGAFLKLKSRETTGLLSVLCFTRQ